MCYGPHRFNDFPKLSPKTAANSKIIFLFSMWRKINNNQLLILENLLLLRKSLVFPTGNFKNCRCCFPLLSPVKVSLPLQWLSPPCGVTGPLVAWITCTWTLFLHRRSSMWSLRSRPGLDWAPNRDLWKGLTTEMGWKHPHSSPTSGFPGPWILM